MINTYNLDLIVAAISAVQDKMYYLNKSINENSLDGSIESVKKQVEIAQVTLDALNFFKERGLGENIDERV